MPAPELEFRELTDAEIEDSYRLGRRAFGFPSTLTPPPRHLSPGTIRHGAFLDGRLVGQAFDHVDQQWWGGRLVDAADIASVAVAPELRGRGIGRALLARLLDRAHERGAVVSALFPTVAAVYRRFGWSSAGSLDTITLPAVALSPGPTPDGVVLREGTAADLSGIDAVYRRIAMAGNGMLSRATTRFEPASDELPSFVDGLTVALTGAEITGYFLWRRGSGYGAEAVLSVFDLLATTPQSARALVGVLHGWHTVTPTVRLKSVGVDAISDVLPLEIGELAHPQPWLHRPVDLAGAVGGRGWPAGACGRAVFGIEDPLAPWNSGTWALDIGDGGGELRRTTDEASVRLTVNGFASLYCGLATVDALRLAGHVSGPSDDAAALDVLATSAPPRLLDSF